MNKKVKVEIEFDDIMFDDLFEYVCSKPYLLKEQHLVSLKKLLLSKSKNIYVVSVMNKFIKTNSLDNDMKLELFCENMDKFSYEELNDLFCKSK